MTEETEIRIPFEDLTRVCFECKQCGAEITIDISKETHRNIERNERQHPMKCPFCGSDFDSQLRGAFSGLISWYDKVVGSGHKVSFRIKRG